MISKYILLFAYATSALGSPNNLRLLFPQDKQYIYEITATLSTGTLYPREVATSWTLEGRLFTQVLGNESQVRFQLDDVKTSVNSENDGYISYQFIEEAKHLKLPWIVEYAKDIEYLIYLPEEPPWVSNIKRALSINFQLKSGDRHYTHFEPCVPDYNCLTTYLSNGNIVKKYTSQPSSAKYGFNRKTVPWINSQNKHDPFWSSIPDTTTMTAERVYKLDSKSGLVNMELKGVQKYKVDDMTLFVNTDLQIQYETEVPNGRLEWPKLTRSLIKYSMDDCFDPSCGIKESGQGFLKNRTNELLLRISKKGIDTDTIVKDPMIFHSIDLINLLNTMAQLNYTTLKVLFEDLVLGTSYELETSRNIFLEVLPYAGSNDAVRFIKFLVLEEKEKIEDSALLSLIRKLPFSNANYSQELLQELEPLTKLGLDFSQELRHAAILSFGTMLYQARRRHGVGIDYSDNMVVKYLRMYSDCPHYMDRLVWLQGLCNIGYTKQMYMEIYTDTEKKRNERLWAAFALNYNDDQYFTGEHFMAVELLLPVLTNETEDVQIRMAALHMFLASSGITQNDFLFVHNFVRNSGSGPMKRFWYTAVKSLESNQHFKDYQFASIFLPSISDLVFELDSREWATNNVVHSLEEDPSTFVHLLSMADSTGLPSFAAVRLSTAGKRFSVYIVAEGVVSNMYRRMHEFNDTEMDINKLVELLKDLKVWAVKSSEEVHVDLVFKIQEKAVFIAHMNQSRFDSWNLIELSKSVNEFLRVGSHINQQMVYYPSHKELIFPNELGIPVKLQSTTVTLNSVRGNFTAPATDLHIRYQGMSVTSLSTYGPLVRSEHVARIQKSMVAHLPLKFNISHTPVGVFNYKTDFMLPIQNGGVVIHTQTHVEKNTIKGVDLYNVRPQEAYDEPQNRSIFADCENSTFNSNLGSLFTGNLYNFYKIFQPSRVVLKLLPLLITPPTSSCGIVHIHNAAILDVNRGVKATLLIENLPTIVDFFSGDRNVFKTSLLLKDYRQDTDVAGEILNLEVDFEINKDDRNIVTRLEFNTSSTARIFLENNDYKFTGDLEAKFDQKQKNDLSIGYYKTSDKEQVRIVEAFILTEDKPREKRIAINFSHDIESVLGSVVFLLLPLCASEMSRIREMQVPQDLWVPLYFACVSESYKSPFVGNPGEKKEITAVLQNGHTHVSVTNVTNLRLKSPEIVWWFDNWITLKKMMTFGQYKECRLKTSQIHTINDSVKDIGSATDDIVALADCTEKPRFAVLRKNNGGLTIYAGSHFVNLSNEDGRVSWKIHNEDHVNDFRIRLLDNVVKIQFRGSGIQIYVRVNETIILVPNSHLHAVCGACLE